VSAGGVLALLNANPIGFFFSAVQSLFGLFSTLQLPDLINRLRFFEGTFRSMATRGLFASQTQRRLVESRGIWEDIGWADPAEPPPHFGLIPPGTTYTVTDQWPNGPNHPFEWFVSRGRRDEYRGDLRWPDGTFHASWFQAEPGLPIDTLPGVGDAGVIRRDFDAGFLARALANRPRRYLGPRPLAGDAAAIRREAFALGGGDVWKLWNDQLEVQSEREGRTVSTWLGGDQWLSKNPNRDLFDRPNPRVYRGTGPNAAGLPLAPGGVVFGQQRVRTFITSLFPTRTLQTGRGLFFRGLTGTGSPPTNPFELGKFRLSEAGARALGDADVLSMPQLLEAI